MGPAWHDKIMRFMEMLDKGCVCVCLCVCVYVCACAQEKGIWTDVYIASVLIGCQCFQLGVWYHIDKNYLYWLLLWFAMIIIFTIGITRFEAIQPFLVGQVYVSVRMLWPGKQTANFVEVTCVKICSPHNVSTNTDNSRKSELLRVVAFPPARCGTCLSRTRGCMRQVPGVRNRFIAA